MKQTNKQRIGLVLPNIPAYSETFFNSKIKGLQENGFEVVLFSKSKSKSNYPSCKTVISPNFAKRPYLIVEFLFIFWQCLLHFKKAFKLFKLNRKEGSSIANSIKNVFINSYFFPHKLTWLHFGFGTMALQSELVAETIGAKMAVSFRGFDLYIYPEKNPKCYALLFSRKVYYHVLSDEMKATLIQNGISSDTIFKITPAIDIRFFKPIENKNNQLAKQFLTIGRLHWKKGIEYTLEAFSLFKQQGIPFHYTIIGEGIEKEKLMFAVHQLELQDYVTFTGKISPLEVKSHFENNDFYVQYSIQEGFCNAVLEAQAMGLLCLVSDADGLAENVLHEKTGWVIPKRNPLLLAQKMAEVMHLDEKTTHEMKTNAMERVQREFNLEKQNQAFKLFYS